MADSIFDTTSQELPVVIGILPFRGSFLFPGTKLNLRLYEMRYIQLALTALAQNRIVGMVQPKDTVIPMKTPDLYTVGCAGRITSFSESDNMLLLTLTGVSRFKLDESENHEFYGYSLCKADYEPFKVDFEKSKYRYDSRRLFGALDRYVYSHALDLDINFLKKMKPDALMMTLASILPLHLSEKQALLECDSYEKFYDTLLLLLEMNGGGSTN